MFQVLYFMLLEWENELLQRQVWVLTLLVGDHAIVAPEPANVT
jgi:hypothetical protein